MRKQAEFGRIRGETLEEADLVLLWELGQTSYKILVALWQARADV